MLLKTAEHKREHILKNSGFSSHLLSLYVFVHTMETKTVLLPTLKISSFFFWF